MGNQGLGGSGYRAPCGRFGRTARACAGSANQYVARGLLASPAFPRFSGRLMPAISPERMRDRYETILAAASRAFAEKGYETTSITEIARAADVSDGLIYKYFSNKRDLLEHVLRKFYERLIEDVGAKVARGKGFREQFYILISEHLSTFVAQRDLCRLFISEVRIAS